MANKEALRELQGRLAERLQEVRSIEHTVGWLAVECAGHAFLFPLAEAGEIFQPGALLSVPHTEPWFLGVANLRGALTGVVDLAGFLGLRERIPAAVREQARVVAFNPALELNAALLIDKLAGLRHADPGGAGWPAATGFRRWTLARCFRAALAGAALVDAAARRAFPAHYRRGLTDGQTD
jgi:twitching motility protein PilI